MSATLTTEVISTSNREIVMHVKECEWARYFRENHPTVGYLMSCSTDEAAYKTANKNIRMQRTGSIMEGNEICDFRVYAVSWTDWISVKSETCWNNRSICTAENVSIPNLATAANKQNTDALFVDRLASKLWKEIVVVAQPRRSFNRMLIRRGCGVLLNVSRNC